MSVHSLNWPPSYTVKRYRRARHVKLRISARNELIVSVPYRFSVKTIPSILEDNREWIVKQLLSLPVKSDDCLPEKIHLGLTGESWSIHYYSTENKSLKLIERPGNELALWGDLSDKILLKTVLGKWLRWQAKKTLIAHLSAISAHCGLPYLKVSIRSQRTIWGSCTSEKAISLNYKLIFLSPELVRYVIIHELCHTKHLNHSKRFWYLVKAFDPAYKEHRKALHLSDKRIPGWID